MRQEESSGRPSRSWSLKLRTERTRAGTGSERVCSNEGLKGRTKAGKGGVGARERNTYRVASASMSTNEAICSVSAN